tara:strand:- start:149 stop:454 length:306 start_codon:yes stop_codon:yes gene_type:complete
MVDTELIDKIAERMTNITKESFEPNKNDTPEMWEKKRTLSHHFTTTRGKLLGLVYNYGITAEVLNHTPTAAIRTIFDIHDEIDTLHERIEEIHSWKDDCPV